MLKINRTAKLQILLLVTLSGLVIFRYHFLWPLVVLMTGGSLSGRVGKNR